MSEPNMQGRNLEAEIDQLKLQFKLISSPVNNMSTDQPATETKPETHVVEPTPSQLDPWIQKAKEITDNLHKYVDDALAKTKLPKNVQDGLSAFIEYLLVYIIALASISFTFFVFTENGIDWNSIAILAWTLASLLLVGFLKKTFQDLVKKKEKTAAELGEQLAAVQTAFNAQSLQLMETKAIRDKLEDYVKTKFDPGFQTRFLFTPTTGATIHK